MFVTIPFHHMVAGRSRHNRTIQGLHYTADLHKGSFSTKLVKQDCFKRRNKKKQRVFSSYGILKNIFKIILINFIRFGPFPGGQGIT